MIKPFPFTKLISAHDEDLTPLIQRAIGKFIIERSQAKYPQVPPDVILELHNQQFEHEYHALALLITKELKNYATTTTSNSSRGSSPSR